jgi:phosphate transport system substrate-binding protein
LAADGVINVPVAVSAQLVNYNIPGLPLSTHLKLNGTILNEIYAGQITEWNDPSIEAINKGVTIPAVKIVPFHRSDSSGDTFLFTSYLYDQDPSGVASSGPVQIMTWPNVSGEIAENGNGGMEAGCIATPGCIAYIGISYERSATKAGLGYAALKNGYTKATQYILPNANSIDNEVASFKHIPSNGGISMINSLTASKGYPDVNFEYAIVKQSSTATPAIRGFLAWAIDPKQGSSATYLDPVYFQKLPLNAEEVAVNLLSSMTS